MPDTDHMVQQYGRKAPSDPTFHPSRDTPHWIGDETATGQQVLLDQGEQPRRADLFGGNNARAIGNTSRLKPQARGNPANIGIISERLQDLGRTSVPTSHWSGDQSEIQVINAGMPGASGYYQPGFGSNPRWSGPQIGVEATRSSAMRTLVHEMGHAHHYDTVTTAAERSNPRRSYHDTRGYEPDPLQEAVADAYVDRFGGHDLSAAKTAGDYSHISDPEHGYSTRYEEERTHSGAGAWDVPDRLLYAGVRAHFGETGEIPRYQDAPSSALEGRSATDATVAMLHEHSPHARAAWQELTVRDRPDYLSSKTTEVPMHELAAQAVRRHKDRKLINEGQSVQESLFGEPEMARNQQGELPRTEADLRGSVGPWEVNMQQKRNNLRGFS